MSQAKIFEENILGGGGGGTNNLLERKTKNIIKGKEMRNIGCVEKEEEKKKKKKKKNKVVQKFLLCSDDQSSVTRELKLVYSTRATSRYQERKDSVFHAPRGRVSPTRVPFYLRAVNGHVGQIRP